MFEEHRAAFEYDWRTRFQLSLRVVGHGMTWGEAWRQLGILGNDPSSCVAAEIAGWSHPIDRVSLILMDLYDLQHASKVKKAPKPYPRPRPSTTTTTLKPGAHLTQDEIVAALRAAGHTALLPSEVPEPFKHSQARDARGRFTKDGLTVE